MRLIDADKLHYIHKYFVDTLKGDIVVFGKEIDKAPTVKAIPIEWIKEWIERDDNYFDKRYAIEDMLDDWEKENEVG